MCLDGSYITNTKSVMDPLQRSSYLSMFLFWSGEWASGNHIHEDILMKPRCRNMSALYIYASLNTVQFAHFIHIMGRLWDSGQWAQICKTPHFTSLLLFCLSLVKLIILSFSVFEVILHLFLVVLCPCRHFVSLNDCFAPFRGYFVSLCIIHMCSSELRFAGEEPGAPDTWAPVPGWPIQ